MPVEPEELREFDTGMVRFTVKELLAQIIGSIDKLNDKHDRLEDRLELALAAKVDRADFLELERRIVHFEKQEPLGQEVISQFRQVQKDVSSVSGRVNVLEVNSASKSAVERYRKWLIGVAIGGAGAFVAAIALILSRIKF